jgi:hypothetical protein
MDQSLKLLMNKTQSESDQLYRALVKNLNTQAGLRIIKDQPQMAIELYEKVLNNKRELLTDSRSFQLFIAHTLFNYIDQLALADDGHSTDKIVEYKRQLHTCEQLFLQPCVELTLKSADELRTKSDTVATFIKQLQRVN